MIRLTDSALVCFRITLFLTTLLLLPIAPVAAQDDDTTDADSDSSEEVLQDWDRLIYVPFKELKDVFDNQDSSAVIPYAEYMELMKAYLEKQGAAAKSPDVLITAADYDATVEKDVVRITAKLTVNVVEGDGWKSVALPFGNCAVGNVKAVDGECLLKGRATGGYELWVKGQGEITVNVDLLASVVRSPEHESFAIQCPTTAIGNLKVSVSKADQDVSILPVQIVLPDEEENGDGEESESDATVVRASLSATNRFEVRWASKASNKPVMDLLASVTNATSARIEPGLLQSTATLTYDVLRGELDEATIVIPAGARVIDVVALKGQIQSWDVETKDGAGQQLQLQLLNAVSDEFQVKVETERDLDGEALTLLGSENNDVQGIHALDVIRETGTITVTTDATLEATVKEMSSVRRTRVAEKANRSEQQAWSFVGQSGRLVLTVKPVEPRLLANQQADVIFDDDQIRVKSKITYTIERAGVFQLAVRYPEDLVIDSVQADGMTEFKSNDSEGVLTLSLAEKRLGKVVVDIEAHRNFDATVAQESVSIPVLNAEGVEREEGQLRLLAPQYLDVVTLEDTVKGLFPDQGTSSRTSGSSVVASAWKYSRKPVELSVRTSPRSAQISAMVATTAKVDPNVVTLNSVVTFDVRNAGVDTFRISVPEAIAADVRFRTLDNRQTIQQRNQADPVDGKVTWTLVLQNEVTGSVPIAVDWEVPLATGDDDSVEADEENSEDVESVVTLQLPEVLSPFEDGAEGRRDVTMTGVTGELRLLRHDSLSVNASAVDDSMDAIDVRELKLMEGSGYLAFRYFEQPASAEVRVTRHDVQEVVETVVAKAAIEVVTDQQRLASYLCQYEITSSERQRIRIDLPANAELQAPRLNNARTTFEAADDTKTEEDWQAYYVNVSRQTRSDEPFVLTLQFRCPITDETSFPFQGQGGRQILRLPSLTESDEAVVIQETRLAVYHPEKVALVGDADRWKYTGETDWNLTQPLISSTATTEAQQLQEWIGGAPETSDFARQGHVTVYRTLGHESTIDMTWWNRPFLVGIISGALLLIGFILRRTSWENRLSIAVLIALGVGIWSLQDRSQTMQFFSAAVPGLAGVAVVWVLSSLRGLASAGSGGSSSGPPEADGDGDGDGNDEEPKPNEPETPVASEPSVPPGAVSPSPDVSRMMDDMMGGKS